MSDKEFNDLRDKVLEHDVYLKTLLAITSGQLLIMIGAIVEKVFR
jgi:hypothetical protein